MDEERWSGVLWGEGLKCERETMEREIRSCSCFCTNLKESRIPFLGFRHPLKPQQKIPFEKWANFWWWKWIVSVRQKQQIWTLFFGLMWSPLHDVVFFPHAFFCEWTFSNGHFHIIPASHCQKGGDRVRVVCSGVRLRAKPMCLIPRLCGALVRLRNRWEKNAPDESETRDP